MKFVSKIKKFIISHKIITSVGMIILLFGGYKIYAATHTAPVEIRYVLGTVQKGILVAGISESGQVASVNQLSIQAKASGNITWVGVKPGQTVYAGQALAAIDSTQAKQAVADAEISLAQSKLQLQQDEAQAPITYQNSINNLNSDTQNLSIEYNNVYNTLSTTYLDLPNVMTGMDDILNGYDLNSSKTQSNKDVLSNLFNNVPQIGLGNLASAPTGQNTAAQASYSASLAAYQSINRTSSTSTMEEMLSQSIGTVTQISNALQSELTFFSQISNLSTQYSVHLPSGMATLQSNARGYLTTVNSDLNSLLAEQKALQNDKNAIVTDNQNISLQKIGNNESGNNPISLQISQNNLAKQEQDLENLKTNLANYTVVAPFAGTISSVTATVGSNAGTIATIVSPQQVATLSLNEVDVAKIALGNKATLTFDAIDGLSMTGTVAEIDPVGTVSQGVVSYNVQITFDTQNPAIKPGMTVNATIQTAVHRDALYVPTSAVKTTNGQSYVLAFDPPLADTGGTTGVTSLTPPTQIPVTTGISNDTEIEIISGLTEGQQIVTRTTTTGSTTKTAPATAPSATSLLGGGAARTRTTTGSAAGFGR